MKSEIINLLKTKGSGRSFVELSKIPGFSGDNWFGEADKNIFYWFNMSSEAIKAINELRKEQKIDLVSTSPFVYHADGAIPNFPVAAQDRRYAKPRWQPAAINKGTKF